MMGRMPRISTALVVLMAVVPLGAGPRTDTPAKKKVLVELFTSHG